MPRNTRPHPRLGTLSGQDALAALAEQGQLAAGGDAKGSADTTAAVRRAVIYVRVSTAGQADKDFSEDGFSIPAQREACSARLFDSSSSRSSRARLVSAEQS